MSERLPSRYEQEGEDVLVKVCAVLIVVMVAFGVAMWLYPDAEMVLRAR